MLDHEQKDGFPVRSFSPTPICNLHRTHNLTDCLEVKGCERLSYIFSDPQKSSLETKSHSLARTPCSLTPNSASGSQSLADRGFGGVISKTACQARLGGPQGLPGCGECWPPASRSFSAQPLYAQVLMFAPVSSLLQAII